MGGAGREEISHMSCYSCVLMSLIYSLRCPFPLIYIQRISCVELWPWRREEPLKDKAGKYSQVKRREGREGQKCEDRRVVKGAQEEEDGRR